jgi:hypothetical protein
LEGLQDLVANPGDFYVVLTGTDSPSGLLRGQLKTSDMGEEVDSISEKLDQVQDQLDVIQTMLRTVGRALGIDPSFLPEPGGNGGDDDGDNGTDGGTTGGTTNPPPAQ